MRLIRRLLCCAVLGAMPCPAVAQEALVLSGGGSRGLAHVGVLEGMAELGYDPDIVVGTSMGAVVGALYAAGYEHDEIRERILAIDWSGIFTPTPMVVGAERYVRYPMINFDLDVARFRVARGIVPQWRINRALARLLFDANARARGDFDRLARRYRAVAGDLRTGDAVVLAEGDLARAARASMSVPGVFAPVTWGDHVLIDGGIVNNLPTNVARALGAETIIAVDVGRPPEEIHSQAPLAVLSRALDLIQENTQRDTVPADVLVLPRLPPGFGATFPADPTQLFEIGLAAALADMPPAGPRTELDQREVHLPPDSVHELLVVAPDSALAALTRRIFAPVAPGPYDQAAVLAAMDRLYTTGLVEGVWPRVVENPDTGVAAPVLLVQLDAPPPVSVSASAGYENDRGARAWVALNRYSAIGPRPAVLTAAASTNGLERFVSLAARVFPLTRPSLAWSTGVQVAENDVRTFAGDATSNIDVLRVGAWLGIELPHILRDRVATAALRADWIQEESARSGLAAGPMLRVTSLNPDLLVVGVPLLIEAETRWGAIAYSRFSARGSYTPDLGPLLLAGVADLRLTSSGAPLDLVPALGDEHAMPGLQWGEERGLTRLVLGADAAYPIASVFARLRLRTGTASENLDRVDEDRWITGAELGVVWRNPLVTVEWGFGMNSRGDRRFDIGLGRYF